MQCLKKRGSIKRPDTSLSTIAKVIVAMEVYAIKTPGSNRAEQRGGNKLSEDFVGDATMKMHMMVQGIGGLWAQGKAGQVMPQGTECIGESMNLDGHAVGSIRGELLTEKSDPNRTSSLEYEQRAKPE